MKHSTGATIFFLLSASQLYFSTRTYYSSKEKEELFFQKLDSFNKKNSINLCVEDFKNNYDVIDEVVNSGVPTKILKSELSSTQSFDLKNLNNLADSTFNDRFYASILLLASFACSVGMTKKFYDASKEKKSNNPSYL